MAIDPTVFEAMDDFTNLRNIVYTHSYSDQSQIRPTSSSELAYICLAKATAIVRQTWEELPEPIFVMMVSQLMVGAAESARFQDQKDAILDLAKTLRKPWLVSTPKP